MKNTYRRSIKTTIFEHYMCPKCKFIWEIPRPMARKREKSHLKKLYCYRCDDEFNFVKVEMIITSYDTA